MTKVNPIQELFITKQLLVDAFLKISDKKKLLLVGRYH